MQNDTTALDLAFAAMEAEPDDDAARLRFHALLADSELIVLLQPDLPDDTVTPLIFDLEAGQFLMAFDTEERLAAFTDAPSGYAALPGRVIVDRLAGQGIGIGLNLGVAPSSFLMGPDAVDWLAATLTQLPGTTEAAITALQKPVAVPGIVLAALATRLTAMSGLASGAALASVTYADGRRGHLLTLRDALPESQAGLAKAIGEALTFSGVEAGEIDVAFVATGDTLDRRITVAGMAFDIPAPTAAPTNPVPPTGPGMDSTKPPRLR